MENKLLTDLSNHDYHGERHHLSSSQIKLLLTDVPKFYRENILRIKEDQKENQNFVDGSYIHSCILEPDKTASEFAFFPGWKKVGPEWREFKEANPGVDILSKPQKVKCDQLIKTYNSNPAAVELVKGIQAEVSLFSNIDDVGIKVRADGLHTEKGYILDVKTTSFETDVDSFKLTMERFHYELSAALYLRLFEKELGKSLDFYFLVLGKTSNTCEVFKLSKDSRLNGDLQIARALRIYKKCLETNVWTNEVDCAKIEYDENYEILSV